MKRNTPTLSLPSGAMRQRFIVYKYSSKQGPTPSLAVAQHSHEKMLGNSEKHW
jgi:hypothetical protein